MKRETDKDMINSTLAFIESRLTENLKINELAEQSFFSKTHYQRLFHSIVGETVMEYVKKRRLQLALNELCDTKTSILEIAVKYGYESHEGFTRAFKSYYGITPSRCRRLNVNQKNYYHGGTMKMRKISRKTVSRINKNITAVSEMLDQSARCLMDLAENMKKSGEGLGNNGATLLICSTEVHYLAKRMEALKESISSFKEHEQMALGIYGEIYTFIKSLDDLTFQTHLLRFLSGIEMARAEESKDILISIEKQFRELAISIGNSKNNIIDLVKDMASLIRADIKYDAITMIKDAVNLLENVADEGKDIVSSARNAAIESKYGKGILCIADTIENRKELISPVKELFDAYRNDLETSDLEKDEFDMPNAERIAEIRAAIYSVEGVAFSMNVAAFNAAIETAQLNDKLFHECSEKIRKYAGYIHQSCNSCTEFFNESVRLTDMLQNGRAASIIALTKKMLDDILFQGKIMAAQLGLEAERANVDVFKNLAQNADKALHIISAIKQEDDIGKCKTALIEYYQMILNHTKDCHVEAEALGVKGLPFEYIASEYDSFAVRIKSGIDCL